MEGSGLVQEHHQEWVISFVSQGLGLRDLSCSPSAIDPEGCAMLGGK